MPTLKERPIYLSGRRVSSEELAARKRVVGFFVEAYPDGEFPPFSIDSWKDQFLTKAMADALKTLRNLHRTEALFLDQ